MITVEELAKLAADMRRLQKSYFRTRSMADLAKSKTAEKRLDQAVEDVLRQPMLFGETGGGDAQE